MTTRTSKKEIMSLVRLSYTKMFLSGFEPETSRVWSERDYHYTTGTMPSICFCLCAFKTDPHSMRAKNLLAQGSWWTAHHRMPNDCRQFCWIERTKRKWKVLKSEVTFENFVSPEFKNQKSKNRKLKNRNHFDPKRFVLYQFIRKLIVFLIFQNHHSKGCFGL